LLNFEFPIFAKSRQEDLARRVVPFLRCLLEDTTLAGTKTTIAQPGKVDQKWWIVDGSDKIVGRLASDIAMVLMGKHLPIYTPHVDCGDFVIVTNAAKVKFTGKKWQQKEYTWFTGYTRQRSVTAEKQLIKKPEMIITEAVRRMLPKNKLATKMLKRLKVFPGTEHPHQAQQPKPKEMGVK
jgi:large subunit ribosomal protein L13